MARTHRWSVMVYGSLQAESMLCAQSTQLLKETRHEELINRILFHELNNIQNEIMTHKPIRLCVLYNENPYT